MKSTLLAALLLMGGLSANAYYTTWTSAWNDSSNLPMCARLSDTDKAQTVYKPAEGTLATVDGVQGLTAVGGNVGFTHYFSAATFHWLTEVKTCRVQPEWTIRVVVGPKPADAASDKLNVTLKLTSGKDGKGQNKALTATYTFPEITLTDQMQELELVSTGVSGTYVSQNCADKVTGKVLNIANINISFTDAQAGQFVALDRYGFLTNVIPNLEFNHPAPTVTQAHGRTRVEPEGTYFVQAEDYDHYTVNNRVAHSAKLTGIVNKGDGGSDGYAARNSFLSMWYEPDAADVDIHTAQNTLQGGMGLWQGRTGDGWSSLNGSPGFAIMGMCAERGGWGTQYMGEYLDETSNKISMEQAMDGFGGWVDYTFDMAEDGFLDLSIAAMPHALGGYEDVMAGGSRRIDTSVYPTGYMTGYKKDRSERGYEVEGLNDDFLKLYGFSYVCYIDGEPLRTNWDIRYKPNPRTGSVIPENVCNPLTWADATETDDNGNKVNPYFLYLTANYRFDNGKWWWPMYKSQFFQQVYTWDDYNPDGNGVVPHPFKVQADEQGIDVTNYTERPDYFDIPVKAGRHILRVKNMGGASVFDEIRLRAKKTNSAGQTNGVESIAAPAAAAIDFSAPVEYYDMQGRRVATPSKGVYILKQGNKVVKQVVK